MKRFHVALASFVSAVPLAVSGALAQSDFYIRSQYADGTFTGFHEILTAPEAGYHAARYCDRTFWVSPSTVAWTEEQAAAGRKLLLEENVGSDRNVVCADYAAFATLEDLGLKEREVERIRGTEGTVETKASRIRNISDAFKQFK